MPRHAALALAALLATAAAARAQDAPARPGDTVPFDLKAGIIFVKGSINDTSDLTFIVDTGASVTVVKPATAEKLGLTKKGERSGGILGTPNFKVAAAIGAGKAVVKDLPVAVMGVPQADLPLSMQGITYDGILGYNYISQFVATFDYKAKTIKLAPNDYVPEDPREAVRKLAEARRPRESDAPSAHAGFTYATIGDDVANEIGVEGGVVVKAVAAESPAAKAGLRKGDVLQEVDGRRVDRAEDWQKALARAKPGQVVKLSVIRDKKDVELELTLSERK
jgi:hypothetical protein